jgi:hypothetical protein
VSLLTPAPPEAKTARLTYQTAAAAETGEAAVRGRRIDRIWTAVLLFAVAALWWFFS